MGTVLMPSTGQAAWPTARHDRQRTGLATGTSNITAPAAYWRYFLGGKIGAGDLLPQDVDGDGQVDLAFLAGGRLQLKHANGDLLWQSSALSLTRLVGAVDLDGDGKLDILASADDGLFVFAAADGSIEWAEPAGEMGTLSNVRVADLDGDGHPDVLIQECGDCAKNSFQPGFVYSFATGFAKPKLLWKLPPLDGGAGTATTLVDVDGDGRPEVMLGFYQTYQLLDGATGTLLSTSPTLGYWVSHSRCRGVDVDGVPGEEILCVENRSNAPGIDERRAYLVHYDVATKTQSLVWSFDVAPDAGGDVSFGDPFVDLDADGALEVVIAGKDASDVWTSYVLDAKTGMVLTSLPGERVLGTAALDDPKRSLVLTAAQGKLSAWSFSQKMLAKKWSLSQELPLTRIDAAEVFRDSLTTRLLTLDVDGDLLPDLPTVNVSSTGVLHVFVAASQPSLAASLQLPTGVAPLAQWLSPPITTKAPQIVLAGSDGYFRVLDQKLVPNSTPGVSFGGYYAAGGFGDVQTSPVVGDLDGSKLERVLVPDSRGALVCVDGSAGTFVQPPTKTWDATHTFAPSIVLGLHAGSPSVPGVVALGLVEPVTPNPSHELHAFGAQGQTLWTAPVETNPFNDIVPLTLPNGAPGLVVQWGSPSDTLLRTRAINAADGTTVWDAPPFDPGAGRQVVGVATSDWNGDGIDDVVFQADPTRVLSGLDGSALVSGGPSDNYFMTTLYDVDGDGALEVTLHGGFDPAQTLRHDLQSSVWAGTDADRPFPYGAIAPCMDSPVLVEGSFAHTARIKMTTLSGPMAGTFITRVLAGGKVFKDETSATAAGYRLSSFNAANVHANLTGQGRPSAVVGSGDGYLYAINPCTGDLDFSYQLPGVVGEAVFGDTDGDGIDEILVTASDGYLYDLKHLALKPPDFVYDTDPPHGIMDDVDVIVTTDTLYCRWAAVEGATSYEVAIALQNGPVISSPTWIDVGSAKTATVKGLPLTLGQTYVCAVRAVGPVGKSPDVMSDGVKLVTPMGTGGAGGAGGASASASSSSGAMSSSSSGAPAGAGGAGDSGDLLSGRACTCDAVGASDAWAGWALVAGLAPLVARRRRRASAAPKG